MRDAAAVSERAASPMAPFRHRAFAILWIATVASNIGTWMHDVGAGWLMTELAPSPVMVAAVQAATTLPIFLFALLAGAIADIVDRRQLLIWVNVAMGFAALAMAVLVHFDLVTPWVLLFFTFLFGTGAAFIAPAWQAIVPKLVPREDLSSAIALNSMGINVSRAIGPALAGVLIVAAGLAAPFLVNALSVIGIVAALWWWRPEAKAASGLPAEHVGGAIIAGVRYAWNSPALKATLIRAAAFFLFASAFWAMLPLIARETLGGGATLYGLLMGSVGAGAVGGALILPKIKARLGADGTVMAGTVGTAIVMVIMAVVPSQVLAIAAAALAGLSWIAVLSSLNVSAQTALPDWVRARGLSVFLTVFFGSMSLGSLAWGQVAALWGIPMALIIAAVGAVALIPLTRWAHLQLGASMDLSPSMHWPEPVISGDVDTDGPVMVQITYRVPTANQTTFLDLIEQLSVSRRRSGAYRWTCLRDADDPDRFIESWTEASWINHQRHHQRVTREDAALQARIADLTTPGTKPEVMHYLTPAHATA
ncbi:MAG: MFS transporter [Paracoccaceae bacterium]|mgnify:CR=1 FL=1